MNRPAGTTRPSSLCEARHLTPEDERKIAAYDAARTTVKTEGNTRAYYVLRAEAAEAEVVRLREALERVYQIGRGPHVGIARGALDACDRGTLTTLPLRLAVVDPPSQYR